MTSTASGPTMMLAPQRRDSGSGKEGDETLRNGMKVQDGICTSASIENLPKLISKGTTRDVPTPKDPKSSPNKQGAGHLGIPRGDQRPVLLWEPGRDFTNSCPETISWPEIPKGSFLKGIGWREAHGQITPGPSDPTAGRSDEVRTQPNAKAESSQARAPVGLGKRLDHSSISEQAQVRSESFYGSVAQSLASRSPIPFRRPKPQPWPSPQDSLGDIISTKSKKIKGKAWAAKGPALELFESQIRPQIEKLLDTTDPSQCAPLFLHMYMMEKREDNAGPIIMICCFDRKIRKDAETLIRESDILKPFPRIGLGNNASPLETNAPVVPVTGETPAGRVDDGDPISFDVHGSGEPVIGRRLRFVKITEGRAKVQLATGGPFLRIGTHIYQLTSTHIGWGDPDSVSAGLLDYDSDDCEYDGQSDEDEDDSHSEEETSTEGSLEGVFETPLKTEYTSLPMDNKKDISWERFPRDDLWSLQDTSDGVRTLPNQNNVDYFLVKLPADEVEKASNKIEELGHDGALQVTDIAAPPDPGTKVAVITSYSHFTGVTIPGTTRVKIHGFNGFQNLLAARLSSPIKPGDSGSAVLDAITGCLYGHVILGSTPDTIVYIVPSVDTFAQIAAIFGDPPTPDIRPPFAGVNTQLTSVQKVPDVLDPVDRYSAVRAERRDDLLSGAWSKYRSPQCIEDETSRLLQVGDTSSTTAVETGDLIPTAIVIKKIPWNVRKEVLQALMIEMNLPQPYSFDYQFDRGVFRGLAFADFSNADDTRQFIERMNQLDVRGHKLQVEYRKILPENKWERFENMVKERLQRRGQMEDLGSLLIGPSEPITTSNRTMGVSRLSSDPVLGRADKGVDHSSLPWTSLAAPAEQGPVIRGWTSGIFHEELEDLPASYFELRSPAKTSESTHEGIKDARPYQEHARYGSLDTLLNPSPERSKTTTGPKMVDVPIKTGAKDVVEEHDRKWLKTALAPTDPYSAIKREGAEVQQGLAPVFHPSSYRGQEWSPNEEVLIEDDDL